MSLGDSKKCFFEAVCLIPQAHNFPLADCFIFVPYYGPMYSESPHLLLMYQITLTIRDHLFQGDLLSDVAFWQEKST